MKKKVIIGVSGAIIVLAIVIGIIVAVKNSDKETILKSMEVTYKPSNIIKLNNEKGYKEKEGFEKNKMEIDIKNIQTESYKINIRLGELTTGTYLSREDIKIGYKFSYEKEVRVKKLSELANDLAFIKGYRVFPGEEYKVEVAIWLPEEIEKEKLNEKYETKVIIERVFE